jgi:hypothetical protein
MNYTSANPNGTSLMGYYRASYAELVEAFGPPHFTNGDKTTAEWCFNIEGTLVTLYDYKTGTTPEGVYDWHVGGKGRMAVAALNALIEFLDLPGSAYIG